MLVDEHRLAPEPPDNQGDDETAEERKQTADKRRHVCSSSGIAFFQRRCRNLIYWLHRSFQEPQHKGVFVEHAGPGTDGGVQDQADPGNHHHKGVQRHATPT